jgi:hypothetical protein
LGRIRSTAFDTALWVGENNEPSKQSMYGTTEKLPDLYICCGKCQTAFALTQEDRGATVVVWNAVSVNTHGSSPRIASLRCNRTLNWRRCRIEIYCGLNIQEGKSPKFMGEKKLYVGNIAFQCHEDDFCTIFSKCGDLGDVSLVRDEEGRNRGFGFVTMRRNDGGSKAVDKLDSMAVRGRNIAVREFNN